MCEIINKIAFHSKKTDVMAKHDYNNVFKKAFERLEQCGFNDIRGKYILDLGCGERYSFSLLCAEAGAKVTAVDLNYAKPSPLPIFFYHIFKNNGIKRAIRSTGLRVLFNKRYYRTLESCLGRALLPSIKNINFVLADVSKPHDQLPPHSFDLIFSNAVLEHVEDIPALAAGINHLLVKGGYFFANFHNFYSLSGGHNREWADPDGHPSDKVPPWDHLRENRFPSPYYLNRYRPEEYLEAFSKYLQIKLFEAKDRNHDPGGTEGERFLTDDLARQLTRYPRDLLLTRGWCLICQKP